MFLCGNVARSFCCAPIFFLLFLITHCNGSGDELNFVRHLENQTANIPEYQWQALEDIYAATNGPDWNCCDSGTNPWNFTNPSVNPCTDNWLGISCSISPDRSEYYIKVLDLADYELQGTIPNSIENLSNLTTLAFYHNNLEGTIPATLAMMPTLSGLDLGDNYFIGSIPFTFGDATQLTELDLSINSLTGTIPEGFSNLALAISLYLNFNALTGAIPPMSNCTALKKLYLNSNDLSGALASTFGAGLPVLKTIDFSSNFVTGSIPDSFGDLSTLQFLYLNFNSLTGTLPSTLGELVNLEDVFMGANFLSGMIPESFINMTVLDMLSLYSNKLTGTIPSIVCRDLYALYLHENQLSGEIPDTFGLLTNIQYVNLGSNSLTGTAPASFSNCSLLIQMLLNDNFFTGSLNRLVSPTNQQGLSIIQVDNNYFTGTIPENLFELNLISLVASVNCFHGVLPTTICGCHSVDSIILNGLSSATACRNVIFPRLSSTYFLRESIHGSVPSCLFQLENVTTIHLSGNGFSGELPNVDISETLVALDLSHNRLVGDILKPFQEQLWDSIDLSYNRLTGSLLADWQGVNASITLKNNRLSGKIPGKLFSILEISILQSNLFSCDIAGNTLPENDSYRSQYICGSTDFNILYYVWIGMIFSVCVCAAVTVYYQMKLTSPVDEWLQFTDPGLSDDTPLTGLGNFFNWILQLTLYCSIFTVFILLPTYWVLSVYYGSYKHQYAYVASAAFKAGVEPFVVEFFLWGIFLAGVMYYFFQFLFFSHRIYRRTSRFEKENSKLSPINLSLTDYQTMFIYSVFSITNVLVVVGVNILYIWVVVNYGGSWLFVGQLILSFFKMLWNYVCLPLLLSAVANRVAASDIVNSVTFNNEFAALLIGASLINNILLPLLVLMFISPNCFYNAFVAAPAVKSTYSSVNCIISNSYLNTCGKYQSFPQVATYNAPFQYNYQCSSNFVTYYSPAFVSMCICSTCVLPVMYYYLLKLHEKTAEGTVLFNILSLMVPRLHSMVPRMEDGRIAIADGAKPPMVLFEPIYFLIEMSTNLGLLFTFGVVFPPLGVALAVATVVVIYSTKLEVGRFVQCALEHQFLHFKAIIEVECQLDFVRVIQTIMWLLICVSCPFYTLFLFDTLGDTVGFDDSFWVLIVVPSFPIIVWMAVNVLAKAKLVEVNDKVKIGSSIELFAPTLNPFLKSLRGSGSNAGSLFEPESPSLFELEKSREDSELDGDSLQE